MPAAKGPDLAGLARMAGAVLHSVGKEMGGDVQVEDAKLATDFIGAVEALTKEIRRLRADIERLGSVIEVQTGATERLAKQGDIRRKMMP